MKRLLFFSAMLFAALVAQGQRFEWAKGYYSDYDDACIKGTITDSLGNLYILGQIDRGSDWDGERLLPNYPIAGPLALVAKISPDGEMVWKKMFGKSTNPTYAQDIRALGDTGFAVMLYDGWSEPSMGIWYWGDTAYTNIYHPLVSPYDTPGRRFSDGILNDYIAFDFDGNITEQHALEISYVDTDGNDVLLRHSPPDSLQFLFMQNMYLLTFDVDNEGNFYMSFLPNIVPNETVYEYNGTICAMRYWVDHRLVGEGHFENTTNHIITKFSPHFDSVLASRYIVQSSLNEDFGLGWNKVNLKRDKSTSNLWVILNLSYNVDSLQNNLVIDSTQNLVVHGSLGGWVKGFVAVYDSLLSPINVIELRDSSFNTSTSYANTILYDIDFDYDSNIVAISGIPGIRDGVFLYENSTLPLSGKSFVMILDKDTYTLKNLIVVPIEGRDGLYNKSSFGNLVLKNNRVFYQDVQNPATTLGLALFAWDYQGNLIDSLYFHTYPRNIGPIVQVDSALYLFNLLYTNATFGDHQVYVSDRNKATIAKYVDPELMLPYSGDTRRDLSITLVDDEGYFIAYPNPAEDLLHVNLEGENILAASAISVLGNREKLDVIGNMVDVSRLQPGIYIMELATMRNTYHFKFIKQ